VHSIRLWVDIGLSDNSVSYPDDIDVSRNGNVVLDREKLAMVRCYKSGFVHAEEPVAGQVVCVLPSPLHAW